MLVKIEIVIATFDTLLVGSDVSEELRSFDVVLSIGYFVFGLCIGFVYCFVNVYMS